ncbi:hypothetical protein [Micromonospora sp. KLBMP9576]|uniref:hypothetical protein n=1 Tax=Micromonospora sp. KLBMP9576 TaxID=3424769 RepID=UPI003D901178
MNPRQAEQALAQVAERRRQSIEAGTAAWSPRALWSICLGVITLGLLTDADMIWLWALLAVLVLGTAWNRGVQLRPTHSSRRWQVALAATFVLALAADIAVQFMVRALGWPLPNTIGAIGAAVTIALLSRPVQARLVASLHP